MSCSDHSDDEIESSGIDLAQNFDLKMVEDPATDRSHVTGSGDSSEPEVIMTGSSYEVIDSDEASDSSVNSAELPDLVPIEEKENKKAVEDPQDEIVDECDLAWVDMLGSGRIHKKIVKKGNGEKAERGKFVKIKIQIPKAALSLDFGTEKCEFENHSEIEVLLGDGLDCPTAVELAVYEINVGGTVHIRSHSDLRGDLPESFAITLLEILDPNLLQLGDKSKEEGNKFWKKGEFKKAIIFYQRGIRLIQQHRSENEDSEVSKDLWIKIMKNIGRCHFKLGENSKSLEKFNEILSADSKNIPVLDLKGDVLLKNKNYAELSKLCEICLKMADLTDSLKEKMLKRIEICKKEKTRQNEKHKLMCERMFNSGNKEKEKTPSPSVPVEEESNFSRNVLIGAFVFGALAVGVWQAKKYI